MAQVPKSSMHDFVTGETVTEFMLDKNFEVLRVAQNDTDSKSAKTVQLKTSAGMNKLAQAMAVVANTINLQEGSSVVITSPSSGVIQIAVQLAPNSVGTTAIIDGAVTATKLDPNILDTLQGIDLGIHRTATTLDHPDQSVTTAKVKDGAVTTIKIMDANVTLAKLAQDVQDVLTNSQTLQWMEVGS